MLLFINVILYYLGHVFLSHELQSSICSKSWLFSPTSLHLFSWFSSVKTGERAHIVTRLLVPRPQYAEHDDHVDHWRIMNFNIHHICCQKALKVKSKNLSTFRYKKCIYLVMAWFCCAIKIHGWFSSAHFWTISL